MVDFHAVLADPATFKLASKQKNATVDIDRLIELGQQKLALQKNLQELQAQGNLHATEVKQAGRPTEAQIIKGRELKVQTQALEAQIRPIEEEFTTLLYQVPNLPTEDTPIGKDDSENVEVRKWGQPKRAEQFGFQPKEHWELGEQLGMIDIERATKISGSRFNFLLGDIALLEFAIINYTLKTVLASDFVAKINQKFGLNVNTKPFIAAVPPVLIKPEAFSRMARLEPKEQRYYIPEDDLYLVGSAEHALGAMYMDETLSVEQLPVRLLGFSTSFRREAGTYGKDTRGILRVHQFDKLEMESFTLPEDSLKEQNFLVAIQEELMQSLGIPYRVVICCTGDQGDPDARHFDIESWLPGQDKYRETHSADLMTDYQTRRMNTRFKSNDGRKGLLHTNDATAFAIGRTIIAIMENYQLADGSIMVPEVLRDFMGKELIQKLAN